MRIFPRHGNGLKAAFKVATPAIPIIVLETVLIVSLLVVSVSQTMFG